ncbi:MAG: divalent cation transporter [Marinosulfonomonas sp.]|nr:divalent cation transporter [Marinosulfonomonas sp.]
MLYALLGGVTIPLGGLIARFENVRSKWLKEELRHSILAFGAGALLSAVALVLVPEGIERLSPAPSIAAFALGGLVFYGISRWLDSHGGASSMMIAMLLDFIPEALAMGAMFTAQSNMALLLALIIALQNLPESFNSFCEILEKGRMAAGRILLIFVAIGLIGPLAAWIGFTLLSTHQAALGVVMLFASGGILYIIFQGIAPKVPLKNSLAPPLGVVAGFMFGLIGQMLLS